jgi:ABC-type bacteriocin/lantibiotic exporter with double-glycine peptidase domain
MGRSKIAPIHQPDDFSCGPAALKTALAMLDKRSDVKTLGKLCKTNGNGTTTKNLIGAINKLGFPALAVEYATLNHLQSALRYNSKQMRAVIVSYLYRYADHGNSHHNSGHWASVCSYSACKSRIYLLDSYTGKKKSYHWADFRKRWMDFDLKRKKTCKDGHRFKLIKKWQQQLMIVIARDAKILPKFTTGTAKLFLP